MWKMIGDMCSLTIGNACLCVLGMFTVIAGIIFILVVLWFTGENFVKYCVDRIYAYVKVLDEKNKGEK